LRDRQYALNLLRRLVEIYSPYGQEDEISSFLLEELESLGLESWRDEVGNVYAKVGGGRPTLLLCGHMDTVPGKLPTKVEGSFLHGRGAVDAKPALAAMILAMERLESASLRGSVLLLGVVDEEGMGRGIRNFMTKDYAVDYAVFGEPSGVEGITIGYKGSVQLKVVCRTEAGHSAAPWLFENAIESAYDLWTRIRSLRLPEEKAESKFYSITSCLTQMRGGSPATVVPSESELLIDLRIPPSISPDRVVREIEQFVAEAEASHKAKFELVVLDQSYPYEADKSSPLVRAFLWAIRRVRGAQVKLLRKTGTSDMNLLQSNANIPMIAYGAGNSHLDHTADEKVDLEEFLDSIDVYEQAIRKLLAAEWENR